MIYRYEEAFGVWDRTSREMRQAIARWRELYYGSNENRCFDRF